MSPNLFFSRIVCFALLLLAASPAAARERFVDAYADAIQALLQDNFADSNTGMVIGLLDEHGSRVFSAGKLDNGTDQQVDGDTVFEIGSVTKTLTSLLLLDMVRRGELKLDDPVAKYLPTRVKVPAHGGKEISLLNLAAQDSGLPFNVDNFTSEDWLVAYNAYTVEDMYTFLSGHKLTIDPGAEFQYSNIGMSLLGHLMELRSGTDFESLVVNRICVPLQMDGTRITLTPNLKTRLAMGHDSSGKRSPNLNLQVMESAGALHSTANDMIKYLSAQLGFSKTDLMPLIEQSQVIRHENSTEYGKTAMPWYDQDVYQTPGAEFLGHGGGTQGYSTFIGFDKRQRRGVVVLTNQRIVKSNRRLWWTPGIGWVILQGLPLTQESGTLLVKEIVGIGMSLDTDEKTGMLRVTKVFPKSPAGQAGLSAGLVIRKINGVSVEGKSMSDCLGMIGGPVGKKVRLELFNPEQKETKTVELTRQKFLTSTS